MGDTSNVQVGSLGQTDPEDEPKREEVPDLASSKDKVKAGSLDDRVGFDSGAGDLFENGPLEAAVLPEEGFFDFTFDYFNAALGTMDELFSQLEIVPEAEKAEFVLRIRRHLIGVKEMIRQIREKGNIEIVNVGEADNVSDLREFYVADADNKVDLAEVESRIDEVEGALSRVEVHQSVPGINEPENADPHLYKRLETMRDTISVKDFLKLPLENRLQLISNVKSREDLKEETFVAFDFGKNKKLEYQIGLGDLMPPSIREISLGSFTYTRRANQGFYNNGKYLAIFTGTKVKIEKKDPEYSPVAAYKEKFKESYPEYPVDDQKIASLESGKRELTHREIFDVATDFGVDAYFLESVLNVMKGDMAQDIHEDYEFLHIAARYIQNAEAQYGSAAMTGAHYSVEFIAYALDRFSLFNRYTGKNQKTYEIIKRYDALRTDVEIQYEEKKVEEYREKSKPQTHRARVQSGGDGEFYYDSSEVFDASASLKAQMQERLDVLEASLENVPGREKILESARIIYQNMLDRLGFWYHESVNIPDPDGGVYRVTNSCTGNIMKVFENSDFRFQRGTQKGEHASQFHWTRENSKIYNQTASRRIIGFDFLRSLVHRDEDMVSLRVTPENVDRLVGEHLMPGECAAAGLAFGHALWIYKDADGTIMMHHSGADYRPKRISKSDVSECPHGYEDRENYYVKKYHESRGKTTSSKVNVVPLSYFLQEKGRGGYTLRFVTLRKLVEANFLAEQV